MEQKTLKTLKTLVNELLNQIRSNGIQEISMEQYQVVCNRILKYANVKKVVCFSKKLETDFLTEQEEHWNKGDICYEYLRFIKRVVRLLSSYALTNTVDFSRVCHVRYNPSEEHIVLITKILDTNKLSGECRCEMDIVMRHFFCYLEDNHVTTAKLTDDGFLDFMINEASITNSGSISRTFRALRFIHSYLKKNNSLNLKADLSMIQPRGRKIGMIPPFSQEEISQLINAASEENTSIGLRNKAIMLLGFNTGLRGVDISKLRFTDIDWIEASVTIRQSKTSEQLTLPLNGIVMNAIADYILKGRPKCNSQEIFVTHKAPFKALSPRAGHNMMLEKYQRIAGIKKKPLQGFHSLRRSFATELSLAGVDLTTISQMLGHKSIREDKPYLSYNRNQVAHCAMDFSDVPIHSNIYSKLFQLVSNTDGKGGEN